MIAALAFVRRHWAAFAAMGVFLGCVVGAYLWGAGNATARVTATYEARLRTISDANAAAIGAALAQARQNAEAAAQAERKLAEAEQATDTHFATITKEVTRYVQTNPNAGACSLDPDGLRLWNQANRGPAARPSGNP